MKIMPFEPRHLVEIGFFDQATLPALELYVRRNAGLVGFSFVADGDIVAVIGLTIENAEARAWLFSSDWARRHPLPFCRALRRKLDDTIADHRLTRVEAHALDCWDGARRLLEHLGFNAAGVTEDPMNTGHFYHKFIKVPG